MGEIGEMNEELQSIYLSNLDEAPARRLAREVFKDIFLIY
jgi:acylglycerol lipase